MTVPDISDGGTEMARKRYLTITYHERGRLVCRRIEIKATDAELERMISEATSQGFTVREV